MSKARLVITAVVVGGRGVREVGRDYGVLPGWVSKLVARYRAEGDAAFEPKSPRPKRSPAVVSTYRVVQWATGNIGTRSLRCRIDDAPRGSDGFDEGGSPGQWLRGTVEIVEKHISSSVPSAHVT
jgi:hypothetical protein